MDEQAQSSPIPETITVDLHCASCGYNMRTLAVDSHCPECGRAIADTIAIWEAAGDEGGPLPSLRFMAITLAWMPILAAAAWAMGLAASRGLNSQIPRGVGLVSVLTLGISYFFPACGFVGAARSVFDKWTTLLGGFVVFISFAGGLIAFGLAISEDLWILTIAEFAMLMVWSALHARRVMSHLGHGPLSRMAAVTVQVATGTIVVIAICVALDRTLFSGTGPTATVFRTRVGPWLAIVAGLATAVLHVTLMWRIASWLAGRRGSPRTESPLA